MAAAGTGSTASVSGATGYATPDRSIDTLRSLPPAFTIPGGGASVRAAIESLNVKLAVIDDDPTGTQTVRNVPLITAWDEDELAWAMAAAKPTFGVLTNSRSVSEERTIEINREIGERLVRVSRGLEAQVRVTSRSDSTLRGHFPAEPEALAAGLATGGERIDCVLVCPAFPEAGRVTMDDVHWLVRDGRVVAAANTEYARDPAFGYRSSNLLEWVRERAGQHAGAASLALGDVRRGPSRVAERLQALAGEVRYVVANAVEAADLDVLALGIDLAEQGGLRMVYRTGPSFLSARAGTPIAEPLGPEQIAMPNGRGLVVVGSHTRLTTAQLDEARARHDLEVVMLDVAELLAGDGPAVIGRAVSRLSTALATGDAVVATTRTPAHLERGAASLESAREVADALVEIVATVSREVELSWLVAKGGITSHDMAVRALGARRVTVIGQLFLGQISVWELGEGSTRPGLRYVVFPGNVGDDLALARSLDRLKGVA